MCIKTRYTLYGLKECCYNKSGSYYICKECGMYHVTSRELKPGKKSKFLKRLTDLIGDKNLSKKEKRDKKMVEKIVMKAGKSKRELTIDEAKLIIAHYIK